MMRPVVIHALAGGVLRCLAIVGVGLMGVGSLRSAEAQPSEIAPASNPYAPGVLRVIDQEPEASDVVTGPFAMREIVSLSELDYTPGLVPKTQTAHQLARSIKLSRPVWTLEFAFKPLRMVTVDVPTTDGQFRRQNVWYLVYRVRNVGKHLQPVVQDDRTTVTEPAPNLAVRFEPRFVLEGLLRTATDTQTVSYLDRFVPVAMPVIAARERPPMPLLNSIEIGAQEIPPPGQGSNERWGVAMWEDINPDIDYLMIFANGLSNGYRLTFDQEGQPEYKFRTLQLNFWRPGDALEESESDVIYGVRKVDDPTEQKEILKLYGQDQPLDYNWIYR